MTSRKGAALLIAAAAAALLGERASSFYRWARRTDQRLLNLEADTGAAPRLTAGMTAGVSLPLLGGARISVEGALCLFELVRSNDIEQVVELGPGASTEIIARSLRKGSGRTPAILGVEHDLVYVQSVRERLSAHLAHVDVTIVHAPLSAYTRSPTTEGTATEWYTVDFATYLLPGSVDLVVVDGPPNVDGGGARQPAFDALVPYLRDACFFFVDDYNRVDERRMVRQWLAGGKLTVVETGASYAVLQYEAPVSSG